MSKIGLFFICFLSTIAHGMESRTCAIPSLKSLALEIILRRPFCFEDADIQKLPGELKNLILTALHQEICNDKSLSPFLKEISCAVDEPFKLNVDYTVLDSKNFCYEDEHRKISFQEEEYSLGGGGYLLCHDKTNHEETAIADGLRVKLYAIDAEHARIAFVDVIHTVSVNNLNGSGFKRFILSDVIESVVDIGFIPHTDLLYIYAQCDRWPTAYVWNYVKNISIKIPHCCVEISKKYGDIDEDTVLSSSQMNNPALPLNFLQQGLPYDGIKLLSSIADFFKQFQDGFLTRDEMESQQNKFCDWIDRLSVEPMIKVAYKKILAEQLSYLRRHKQRSFCCVS